MTTLTAAYRKGQLPAVIKISPMETEMLAEELKGTEMVGAPLTAEDIDGLTLLGRRVEVSVRQNPNPLF